MRATLSIDKSVAFFRSSFMRLSLSHAKECSGGALRALFEAADQSCRPYGRASGRSSFRVCRDVAHTLKRSDLATRASRMANRYRHDSRSNRDSNTVNEVVHRPNRLESAWLSADPHLRGSAVRDAPRSRAALAEKVTMSTAFRNQRAIAMCLLLHMVFMARTNLVLQHQPVHLCQRLISHGANRAQRMRLGDKVFQSPHGEQAFRESVCAAHRMFRVV